MAFLRATLEMKNVNLSYYHFLSVFSIEKVTSLVDDRGTLLRRAEMSGRVTSPEPSCSKAE